jgi:hypothetical protein
MAADREARDAAMVLTSLLVGGESQLEVFRRRRAADPELALEHLERARNITLFLSRAITVEEDEDVWERVERAWEILTGDVAVAEGAPDGMDDSEDEVPPEPSRETDEEPSRPSETPVTEPRASEPRKPARVGESVAVDPDAPPIFDTKRSSEPERSVSKWADIASNSPVSAPPRVPATGASDADEDPIGATTQMGAPVDSSRSSEPAMPFAPGDAAPEPVTPGLPQHQAAGQTLTGEIDLVQTLPFDEPLDGPLEAHLAAITMEQYAALSAECTLRPDRRAAAHARYEIAGESERDRLDAYWTGRLGSDEALAARFRELLAHYEQWVRAEQ